MTGTDSGFLNIYQLYSLQGEKGKQKAKKMYMIKGTNKEKTRQWKNDGTFWTLASSESKHLF